MQCAAFAAAATYLAYSEFAVTSITFQKIADFSTTLPTRNSAPHPTDTAGQSLDLPAIPAAHQRRRRDDGGKRANLILSVDLSGADGLPPAYLSGAIRCLTAAPPISALMGN